jgi:hypothetical protein
VDLRPVLSRVVPSRSLPSLRRHHCGGSILSHDSRSQNTSHQAGNSHQHALSVDTVVRRWEKVEDEEDEKKAGQDAARCLTRSLGRSALGKLGGSNVTTICNKGGLFTPKLPRRVRQRAWQNLSELIPSNPAPPAAIEDDMLRANAGYSTVVRAAKR